MAPNAWEIPFVEVIGVARLAYKDSAGKTRGNYWVGLSALWEITDILQQGDFRAIVLRKYLGTNYQRSIKVMSFSGSDFTFKPSIEREKNGVDIGDWTGANWESWWKSSRGAEQYQFGLQKAQQHKPNMVIGHSLGGGIANYVSFKTGIKSATINPAPLMGAGFGGRQGCSTTINYVASEEMLGYGRDLYQTNAIGKTYVVGSSGKDAEHKHYLSTLHGFSEPFKINR